MQTSAKPHPPIPSARSIKRASRKQLALWEDPDQPGALAAPPRSPVAASASDGKDLKHAQARTSAPALERSRSLAAAGPGPAGEPAHAAAAPRKSLCSRTTKWLAGIAGLAMIGMASRHAGFLLPSPSTLPSVPLDGLALREESIAERASPPAETPALVTEMNPWSRPGTREPAGPPMGPHTLSNAIDLAFATGGSHAIQALSLQLGGRWPQKGLPVETVERMVDAYRKSMHWRAWITLENFLDGIMMAIGPMRMSDEQLEQLLKVWSWRYGEAQEVPGKDSPITANALRYSFAFRLAQGLGGQLIPESQLRLLIGTACREPEDTIPETILDRTFTVHAAWAAAALIQVMHAISIPQGPTGMSHSLDMISAQARRCLKIFLHTASEDSRWKYLVVRSLHINPPTAAPGRPAMDENWQDMILSEVRKYLAETVPSLEPRPTLARALTALYDPGLLMTGQVMDL